MRASVLAGRATARLRHRPTNLFLEKSRHTFLVISGKVKLSYGKEESSTRCQWNTFNLLYAMTSCRSQHTLWTHHSFSGFSLKLGMAGRLAGCSTYPNSLNLHRLPDKCLQGLSNLPFRERLAIEGRPSTFLILPEHIRRYWTEALPPLFEMSFSHTERTAATMWYRGFPKAPPCPED